MTQRLTVIPDSIQLLVLQRLETADLDPGLLIELQEAKNVVETMILCETDPVQTLGPFV
jgi:hypothetical protein